MSQVELADVIEAVRSGAAGVLEVADPASTAARLAREPGVVLVGDVGDLASAVAAARVRLAEVVVERARRAEVAPTQPPADGTRTDPEPAEDDDHRSVRFAFVILALALPAGLAVYVVDGILLAAVLPGLALVALGAVVLAHRRPVASPPAGRAAAVAPGVEPADVEHSPAVRAAEAHLRRQQAAWKLSWWERGRSVPDLALWSPAMSGCAPITLVATDAHGGVDDATVVALTATAPAAVRVVVLQATTRPPGLD